MGRGRKGEHRLHRWRPWRRRKPSYSAALLTSDGSSVPYPAWSFHEGLELVYDPAPAAWVEASLEKHPWATVGNILPDGFEAYARVLHPAYKPRGSELEPVRWAAVAQMTGNELHPRSDFGRLAGIGDDANAQVEWGQRPREGELPTEVAEAMVGVLGRHTATPADCWFCVWLGWGTLFALEGYDEATYPHVKTPGREHLLLRGSIEMAGSVGKHHVEGPSIWWPDDHAWCVATEIDLDSTYVGGSRACIDELLAEPSLEVFPASITDRLGVDPGSPA